MGSATGTWARYSLIASDDPLARLALRSRCPTAGPPSPSCAASSCKAVSCSGKRFSSLKSAYITKLRTGLPIATQKPMRMALLSTPLLFADVFLRQVSSALATDGLPSFQLIELVPLADLDPAIAILLLRVLGPVFSSLNFLFIIRIVMSWYPQLPVNKFPYIIAFAPTEPVLEPTRRFVPPIGGVDISPVIWVAIISFVNEILLGQQGLLVLLSQQQG